MNDYLILDGYCYKTVAKTWVPPVINKPMTARLLLDGSLDVTYGGGTFTAWSGEIIAEVEPPGTPPGPGLVWGTPDALLVSLGKREGLAFTDHYGNDYTVHIQMSGARSLLRNWDAPSNKLYYSVKLIAE